MTHHSVERPVAEARVRGLGAGSALGEILLVVGPLVAGYLLGATFGDDHLALGGDTRVLHGPFVYLGLASSLGALWFVSLRRGTSWRHLGVEWPETWGRIVGAALATALVAYAAIGLVGVPLLDALSVDRTDVGMYSHLSGNLPNLVINLVLAWGVFAMVEELVFRGFLIPRVLDLLGSDTYLTRTIAAVTGAVLFGLAHAYLGIPGMIQVGLIGGVLGGAYFVWGRRLWPLVIAHGLLSTLELVSHYFD